MSVVHPLALAAMHNMGAVSARNDDPQRASRPFDADRDGFVMGEGAGVLVVESLRHARRRGAHIRAEVVGYGASCDAFHITAPDENGAGAALSMTMALRSAGLRPDGIDYINAHGTSTLLNDRIETLAIHKVFGPHAGKVPVSSTKSMVGHLMGGSGCSRGDRLCQDAGDGHHPSDDQLRDARPGLRPGLCAQQGAAGQSAHGAVELVRVRRPQRHAHLPPLG